MTLVRINPGASFDLVGPKDLAAFRDELLDRYRAMVMEQLRGEKIFKIPQFTVTAANTNPLLIPSGQGGGSQVLLGPTAGYIWRVGRITVHSSGSDNAGVTQVATNPVPSQPAVPASATAIQNTNTYPVTVVISGGTGLTAVVVNGITVGTGDGTYIVPAAGSISVTYTTAPTWVWSNANGAAGSVATFQPGGAVSLYTTSDGTATERGFIDNTLQLGEAYYPASHGVYLFPDEQLLARVATPVTGNSYTISGLAWSVPAEMMGKLV